MPLVNIEKIYECFRESSAVVTDTRKIVADSIFFALKGETFNGNHFAEDALSKGAKYVVVDELEFVKGERYLYVNNVLETLQALANYYRSRFDIPVIAITGSNGKTTTKELVASVLSKKYKTHYTKGNFNNHIGLPLTLLEMPMDTEIAVVEMGANHQREIAALCEIARPNYGLVTNIGKAHLEGFGGIEGVKKGKGELYDYLSQKNMTAFVNADELFLSDLSKSVERRFMYGKKTETENLSCAVELLEVEPNLVVSFGQNQDDKGRYSVSTNLVGLHNFNNIMTAVCLGEYFEVDGRDIKLALEEYIPRNNRSEWRIVGSNTFLLDAYNANPTSTAAALDYFQDLSVDSKMVILGDMLELGDYGAVEHRRIVDRVLLEAGNLRAVFVGKCYQEVITSEDNCLHFEDVEGLRKWFIEKSISNNHILLKGSRGVRLEQILSDL